MNFHLVSMILLFIWTERNIFVDILIQGIHIQMYIYIIMWSCPGNMPKYYPDLRDILPDRRGG
jgi:hypothetical protein